MDEKNILDQAIESKIDEERYEVPKEKEEKKKINFQLILVISVILSLIASILRLL